MTTATLEQLVHMNEEWEAWQEVIRLLRVTQAVTEEELSASILGPFTTPGTQLLEAIRQWGERLAELRIEQKETEDATA